MLSNTAYIITYQTTMVSYADNTTFLLNIIMMSYADRTSF